MRLGKAARLPNEDRRTARAIERIANPRFIVTNAGIYVDDDGKLAIRLNANATITQDANGLSANAAITALAAVSTNGLLTRTATDTYTARTIAQPAAGITVTNPAGTAGNPTFALANDLAALEGLGSTGLAARTAADTWAQRAITGTANQVVVVNGDGVAGNPTLSTPQNIHAAATPMFAGLTLTSIVTWSGTTVAFAEAVNETYGTATGTKHGTATDQKQAFWGTTPIVQPAHADQAAVTINNSDNEIGGLAISAAYDQAEIQALRDKSEELADDVRALSVLVHALRTALVNTGLIKGIA